MNAIHPVTDRPFLRRAARRRYLEAVALAALSLALFVVPAVSARVASADPVPDRLSLLAAAEVSRHLRRR
ncbi:MAG: hypothetical protein RMK78_06435 [Thermaurantiacus sp.]|uniref:hypothetical protein n=1 Tax=Thermaurantiacus sp. TaxID=2820283 RepID=UPI00298F3CC2|nr:hypothetical protein [Thermaurantiacus sp.]MDW8415091.1 hypothetical protein [Thermaurantiacus sp.]